MNCEDMAKIPQLNKVLNIKAGAAGMKNIIRWIYFADCLQCVKNEYHVEDYIHGGEFVVLTNPEVTEDKTKLMALITSMVDYGIAAIGINEGQILPELIEYCNKVEMPLFELPVKFPLVDLSQILCKRLVLEENNRNLEEQVFASILDAEHLNRDSVLEQANFLGKDMSGCFCVIEFTFEKKDIKSKSIKNENIKSKYNRSENLLLTGQKVRNIIKMEFSAYHDSILVMQQAGSILALVSTDRISNDNLRTVLRHIIENAKKNHHICLKAGIGSSVEYLEDVKVSRKEAAEAIKIASFSDANEHIFFYKEQGIYTFISKITDSRFLDDYVVKRIGRLIEADEINNGCLCETLESFLNHNCNVKETAQSLIIHRNTLNYRLNKIRELLDVDFENLEICLEIKLAFMIKSYRGRR